MSASSGGAPAPIRITIEAAPGTEIDVIDHTFRVLHSDTGTLRTEVAPGLYKLRYRAGFTVREEFQAIEPGGGEVSIPAPPLTYGSAAPLPGTRDCEPYHQAAGELSRAVHDDTLGQGSELFVFARAAAGPAGLSGSASKNPAAGLSLHDRAGKRLLNLGKLAGRAGAAGRWAGCTVALEPGEYRLHYRPRRGAPERQQLEQVIVTSSGWQTQVFLTSSPGGPAGGAGVGGLALARTAVLQARIGHGFDPPPGDARLADLARIGLISGHAIVTLPRLLDRLSGESPDPMLGIYTAHALLQAGDFDEQKLREVVAALRALLRKHPDIEALAHHLGLAGDYVFDCPPMLTSSWSLILKAAERQPSLVPAGSLAARAATHLWGRGPWLLWLSDELASASPPRVPPDVPGLVARASDAALLGFRSRREAADDDSLDDAEAVMLTHFSRPLGILVSRGALDPQAGEAQVERSQQRDALEAAGVPGDTAVGISQISQDLGAALSLPPAAIPQIAASLVWKLEHTARSRTRFRLLGWRLRGPLARGYLRLRRRKGPGSGRPWRGRLLLHADWWQLSRARLYRRRALDRPYRTVGGATGEVAGRDELCQVIIDDLRSRDTRRPHVIVADAGAGKTALLARLGRLLAGQGAVPVTVRLRDAQHDLDFRELAHRQFVLDEHSEPLAGVDRETVWRRLSRRDKIVVLADGLEEALAGEPGPAAEPTAAERDSIIRLALRRAREQRLPLVVTSRSDSAQVTTDAAVMELEPLSEETALEWLHRGNPGGAAPRPDWPAAVVTRAGAAGNPVYLQIARQLQAAGLVPDAGPPGQAGFDTHVLDRADLQFWLLDTWMQALLAGNLAPGVPLSPADRTAAVDQLSALACVGVARGTRLVRFGDFKTFRGHQPAPAFLTEVAKRLASTGQLFGPGMAAVWGMELGLAEAQPSGVQFPDGIIQAYLASRLVETAMADEPYPSAALAVAGSELLTALVMGSRASARRPAPGRPDPGRPAARSGGRALAGLLLDRASTATGVTVLDLYAAALQIDSSDPSPAHGKIADEIADRWAGLSAEDQPSLDRAKLNLIHRLGEAARTVAARQQAEPEFAAKPAYPQLYRIAVTEPSHRLRMESAQQIGASGDAAFAALQGLLAPPPDLVSLRGTPRTLPNSRRLGQQASLPGGRQPAEDTWYDRLWREAVVRAWLAPFLAGSVTSHARAARQNLDSWLWLTSTREHVLGPWLEAALAQGFKYAANHRCQPQADPQARDFLLDQAREMLTGTRFWFARLTLVQALCLLSLDSGPARRLAGGRDIQYGALVTYWAGLPAGEREHRFVAEAHELAVRALETGQPERFLWIDESTTAATVGPPPADPRASRRHPLWIPPSAGWAALHPRAAKLLAEVVLLLNLAERGSPPHESSHRLRRIDRSDLPPCLAWAWSPLQPALTIGGATKSHPGTMCMDGCAFELCPYPPHGEMSLVELSEAFCRRQEALDSNREEGTADRRRFWRQMARRARS